MTDFFNKFKIPTLLGFSIIIIGIIIGVVLVLKEQIFLSQASPDISTQNITLSNISDDSVAISWQTSAPVPSFITFGQTNSSEATALDGKDVQSPKAHLMHYVTIKNLLPKTTYQYKIVSGKTSSEVSKFTTAIPITSQTGFRPIIGSVLDKGQPLDEGIIYLSITDANTQSAQIKSSGNFLIPLTQIRKADLSDAYPLTEDTIAKLTVISDKGIASALFTLKMSNTLPPLNLGQNVDLTTFVLPKPTSPVPDGTGASPSAQEIKRFDLNSDGKINAADNVIILQNFGKKPKDKKVDLNSDGKVDQKDLDLMAKQINQ